MPVVAPVLLVLLEHDPAQLQRGVVPAQPGVTGVGPGQQEGGEELGQSRDHRHVHRAGHRACHEVRGADRGDYVGEIPGEEGEGGRDDEPAIAAAHFPEGRAAVHFEVDLGRAGTFVLARPLLGGHGRGHRVALQLAPPGGDGVVPRVVDPRRRGVTPFLLLHRTTLLAHGPVGPVPKDEQRWPARRSPGAPLHPIG